MSSPSATPPATERATLARDPATRVVMMLAGLAWQFFAATGTASIALGVIVLIWPRATLFVIGILFGIYLIVSGAFHVVGALGEHVPRHLRAVGFVTGTLSILLGLICFRRPAESVVLLAFWIGFAWLIHGIGQTISAAAAPAFGGRGWLIATGLLMAVAGVVVVSSPISSISTLTLIAGIWLIVIGVSEVVEAVRLRPAARS